MNPPFLQQIDRTERQQARSFRRAALAQCVTMVLGLAMLFVAVDWIGRFSDPGLRWLFSGTLVALLAALAWRLRGALFGSGPGRLSTARQIEESYPQLGSRLASAVEFFDQASEDPTAGSAELRRAVVIEAQTESDGLDFTSVVDHGPLRKMRHAFLAALACLGLFALIAPSGVATGFARLAMPWSDTPWPRRHTLVLVNPPRQLASGDTLELVVEDRGGNLPEDLYIEYRSNGRTESQPMQWVGNQGIARREGVTEPLNYRAVGGDDHTMAWHALEVLEPPQLIKAEVRITPPPYSGLPGTTETEALRLLEGSALQVAGEADQPLTAAWAELPGEQTIPLEVDQNRFTSNTKNWQAETSATGRRSMRLALEATSGVVGHSEPRPYQVLSDKVPVLEWIEPSGDLFVTPRAEVALKLRVEEDLAVRRAWVTATPVAPPVDSTAETTEETTEAPSAELSLHEGPEQAAPRKSLDSAERLELNTTWDLATLGFTAGTRLDLVANAEDYRPGLGRTPLPRRVFLVTDEELEARLAQKQSRLLAEVQRAVDRQRSAREQAEALLAEAEVQSPVDRTTLDRLASTEFEQRQASQRIASSQGGAAALAEQLAEEVRRNRLDRPELETQLSEAASALRKINASSMADAKRGLATARRAADRSETLAEPLRTTTASQAEAVEGLEQVAQALTGWADYRRLTEELANLETKQRDLAERTTKLAAESSARNPLRTGEILAKRQKITAEQAETSRRFEKLRESMHGLLKTAPNSERTDAQNAVADAGHEASQRDISGGLREASRQLARSRLGRAAAQQQQTAEDLREMLAALRQRGEQDPAELIQQLREAKQRLQEAERQTADAARQSSPQDPQQQQLAEQTERLARRLSRLTAQGASQSTQQAAQAMQQPPQQGGQQGGQQETPQQERLAQAENALQKAQEQTEQRIEQLEEQQTQKLLDQLAAQLPRLLTEQQRVLDQTAALDGAADPNLRRALPPLHTAQTELGHEVTTLAEGLASKAVFELALQGTAVQMNEAAQLLAQLQVGRQAQRAEFRALERLKHIDQVLRDERKQREEQQEGGGGQGGGQGGEPPPPSPIDVAELKMLRLMQIELIDQTDRFEADRAEGVVGDWPRIGLRLAAEQQRLAELALEMAERKSDAIRETANGRE